MAGPLRVLLAENCTCCSLVSRILSPAVSRRSDGHSSDARGEAVASGFYTGCNEPGRHPQLSPRARQAACFPCLSCTARGLSCPRSCVRGGGLLTRHFTLTGCGRGLHRENGKTRVHTRRYIFCDTFRQNRLATALPAFVTRRAALWCPDFPPTLLAKRRRPSRMQHGQPDTPGGPCK